MLSKNDHVLDHKQVCLCVGLIYEYFAHMYYRYAWAYKDQKKASDFLEPELQTFVHYSVDVGIKSGSLEKQPVLLIDKSSLWIPLNKL